jgi:hypothetical protein
MLASEFYGKGWRIVSATMPVREGRRPTISQDAAFGA